METVFSVVGNIFFNALSILYSANCLTGASTDLNGISKPSISFILPQ